MGSLPNGLFIFASRSCFILLETQACISEELEGKFIEDLCSPLFFFFLWVKAKSRTTGVNDTAATKGGSVACILAEE